MKKTLLPILLGLLVIASARANTPLIVNPAAHAGMTRW